MRLTPEEMVARLRSSGVSDEEKQRLGDRLLGLVLAKVTDEFLRQCCFATEQDAEDAAGETALRAWKGLGTFNPEKGHFDPWLEGIADNTVTDSWRKERSARVDQTIWESIRKEFAARRREKLLADFQLCGAALAVARALADEVSHVLQCMTCRDFLTKYTVLLDPPEREPDRPKLILRESWPDATEGDRRRVRLVIIDLRGDVWERASRPPTVSFQDDIGTGDGEGYALEDVVDGTLRGTAPEREALREDFWREFWEAARPLQDDAVVLYLHSIIGLEYGEIAAIYGINGAEVRKTAKRARTRLAKALSRDQHFREKLRELSGNQ